MLSQNGSTLPVISPSGSEGPSATQDGEASAEPPAACVVVPAACVVLPAACEVEMDVVAAVVGIIEAERVFGVVAAVDKVDVADTEAVGSKPEGNTVTAVPVTESAGWSVNQVISLAGGSV